MGWNPLDEVISSIDDALVDLDKQIFQPVARDAQHLGQELLDFTVQMHQELFNAAVYAVDQSLYAYEEQFKFAANMLANVGIDTSFVEEWSEYAHDSIEGFSIVANAAFDGDERAMAIMGAFIVTGILTFASFGATSPASSSTLANILSYASTAYSAKNAADKFVAVKEMEDAAKRLKATIAKIKKESKQKYTADAVYSLKNDWMAGSDFYNALYAGGDLFNITGSRNQSRFLGLPDTNIDQRFGWMNDRYAEYYKKLNTHTIGTDNFSVLNPIMI